MVNNLLVHFYFSNFWVFHSALIAMAMLMTSLVVMALTNTVAMKMDMVAMRNDRDDGSAL